MTTRLFVLLLTALTALVLNVRGQTLVDGLPDRLPIGDQQTYRDWIVTNNPSYVGVGFRYTNVIGKQEYLMPTDIGITLRSFWEFEEWVYQIGNVLIDSIKDREGDRSIAPDQPFRFIVMFSHPFSEGPWADVGITSIGIYADFPHFGEIVPENFRNMHYSTLFQMFYIPGLDKIEIKVPNKHYVLWTKAAGTKYKYEGEVNRQDGFIPPKEYIISDVLALAEWYSIGRYPGTRFTIGANGIERTYTEFGEPLGVSLEVNRDSFIVHATAGSQVKVEYTEDFKSWHSLTDFQATPENTTFVIPVYTDQPQRFLRASAY